MLTDIGEITNEITKYQNDTVWQSVKKRLEDDFKLYYLKAYNPGKNYVSFTTNMPRVNADKAISLLTQANLIIRIPLDYLREKDREEASNVERLLYGCFNLNDRDLKLMGQPILRDQMAWYSTIRGGFFLRPYIYKNKKGETVVSVAIWDRYNVAYGIGKDGIAWAANTRRASKYQILDEWGVDIGGKDDEVIIDFWSTESNGVIIANEWAKPLEKHGLDFCPVYEVLAGAMPRIYQSGDTLTNMHVGESIFAGLRHIAPIKNKTFSDALTLLRRNVKSPLAYKSADGTKTLDEDIWQVEKAACVPMEREDTIEPLLNLNMPPDMATILQEVSIEEQLAGFPRTAFGQLAFRLSGLAINQLKDAIGGVIQPFIEAMRYGYDVSCISLLDQYAGSKLKPLKIRGRTSREAFGYPDGQEIKPKDIKHEWYPEVKLEAILPEDDPQQMYMAKMAKDTGLLDDATIQDKYLGVRDTDLVENKLGVQWAANIPLVKLQRAYDAALERGELDDAAAIKMEIIKYVMAEAQQQAQAGGQGAAPTGQEMASAEVGGVGMPAGETGFPPSIMPPEQLGGLPGGAM